MIGVSPHPDGCVLSVKVSPGASRDRILGGHAGALKLSVSAAPEKGKANKAVCALLAKHLHVPASHVSIIAGKTSRDKKVLIHGTDARAVAQALADV